MATVDELLVGLGFEYDKEGLDEFKTGLKETTNEIKAFTKKLIIGTIAIKAFVTATSSATDAQGELANEIGESVGKIDALQHAMAIAGGSTDGMGESLKNLSTIASEAARGLGGGIEIFGMLGISATNSQGDIKKSTDLVLEISDAIRNFPIQQQVEFANRLGLGGSIQMLRLGSEGIRELTDEAEKLGVVTNKDWKASDEYLDSYTKIWRIIKQISKAISFELLPTFTAINNKFIEWWKTNKDIIKANIPIWIDRITLAIKLLVGATALWISFKFGKVLLALVKAYKALAWSAALANAAILLIPIAIGLIVAAIALLFNDIRTYFSGGDSYIGDLIERFPEWKDTILAVIGVINTLYEAMKSAFGFSISIIGKVLSIVWSLVKIFWKVITSLADILLNLTPIGAVFKIIFGVIGKVLEVILKFSRFVASILLTVLELADAFSGWIASLTSVKDFLTGISNVITGIWDKWVSFINSIKNSRLGKLVIGVSDKVSAVVGDVAATIERSHATLPQLATPFQQIPNNSGLLPVPGAQNRTSRTSVDRISININGAGDPSAVGRAVVNEFQKTSEDLNSTVDQ